MQSEFFESKYEEKVISLFNSARDEEYKELNKLLSWYAKIEARDVFHSSQRDPQMKILKKALNI